MQLEAPRLSASAEAFLPWAGSLGINKTAVQVSSLQIQKNHEEHLIHQTSLICAFFENIFCPTKLAAITIWR